MKDISLTIIIPTTGKNPELKDCLKSIKKQENHDLQIHTITITNQQLQKLRKAFSFAKAVNHAAKKSTSDYLLITNDDIVFEINAFVELEKAIKKYPDSLLGASILDKKTKKPAPSAYSMSLWTGIAKPVFTQRQRENEKIDWISGCALIVSRKNFKLLNGFDENFNPGMFEDADFCLRAQRMGLKIILLTKFKVRHTQTATFNKNKIRKYEYWYRNKILLLKKHASLPQLITALFLQYALYTPARALVKNDGRFLPALKGLIWNLKKPPTT